MKFSDKTKQQYELPIEQLEGLFPVSPDTNRLTHSARKELQSLELYTHVKLSEATRLAASALLKGDKSQHQVWKRNEMNIQHRSVILGNLRMKDDKAVRLAPRKPSKGERKKERARTAANAGSSDEESDGCTDRITDDHIYQNPSLLNVVRARYGEARYQAALATYETSKRDTIQYAESKACEAKDNGDLSANVRIEGTEVIPDPTVEEQLDYNDVDGNAVETVQSGQIPTSIPRDHRDIIVASSKPTSAASGLSSQILQSNTTVTEGRSSALTPQALSRHERDSRGAYNRFSHQQFGFNDRRQVSTTREESSKHNHERDKQLLQRQLREITTQRDRLAVDANYFENLAELRRVEKHAGFDKVRSL